ncbi:MAG: hypothetical protein ACRD1T_15250, partial [Acidimicrobiia bacterium]
EQVPEVSISSRSITTPETPFWSSGRAFSDDFDGVTVPPGEEVSLFSSAETQDLRITYDGEHSSARQ